MRQYQLLTRTNHDLCQLASLVLITASLCLGCGRRDSTSTTPQGASAFKVEEVLTASLHQCLNQAKQQLFNGLHPVGTAKGVTVHDVAIMWKHGQRTNRPQDVQAYTVRYTLYWQGPMTTDGYTKVSATFDTESQRWTAMEILATNGMTNQDAGEALVQIGGTLLLYSLNSNQ